MGKIFEQLNAKLDYLIEMIEKETKKEKKEDAISKP